MARRGVSEAQKRASAVQAARRMISRGERPGYRLLGPQDGVWTAVGLPGVSVAGGDRWAALDAMRAAIAVLLEVDPDAFDLV